MKSLRAVLFALTLVVVSPNAPATSFSTDQSDLFFISTESGWGIQLVQRGSVIFATMFVYGPSGTPTWYVATMNPVGSLTWSGDLYTATGSWFGTVPYNPASFIPRRVGTMTWSAPFVTSGTVSYVVDGVAVVKNVVRESLALDDYSGTYLGAAHLTAANCSNPANNVSGEGYGVIAVFQSGQNITVTFTAGGVTITINGVLGQDGQFGSVSGTYSATGGEVGNATLFEMNVQLNALSLRFLANSTNDGCQNSGYMGGIRSRP
jgi:hypothetical protein